MTVARTRPGPPGVARSARRCPVHPALLDGVASPWDRLRFEAVNTRPKHGGFRAIRVADRLVRGGDSALTFGSPAHTWPVEFSGVSRSAELPPTAHHGRLARRGCARCSARRHREGKTGCPPGVSHLSL